MTIYAKARDEARSELEKVRKEFERLSQKKLQLEAFLANIEPLIQEEPMDLFPAGEVAQSPMALVSKSPTFDSPAQPIWKSILLALNGTSETFSVRTAVDALDRIGRGIASPNRYQIVRAVLNKKEENFEKVGAGLYKIKRGLGHEKAASEEAA